MNYQKIGTIGLLVLATLAIDIPSSHAGHIYVPNMIRDEMELDDSRRWTPSGNIQPAEPVTIVLTNKTNEPVEYLLNGFHPIAPGKSVTLRNIKLPIDLHINGTRSAGLTYGMQIKGNRISLDLKRANGLGNTVLNIDRNGTVYLY